MQTVIYIEVFIAPDNYKPLSIVNKAKRKLLTYQIKKENQEQIRYVYLFRNLILYGSPYANTLT